MDERYQVVTLPITVPNGEHCWNMENKSICSYFEASGGNPKCNIHLGFLEHAKNGGVLKPGKCKLLK